MFRATCLAALSVFPLAVATPASAQYLYGDVHEGFDDSHWHTHGGFGQSYHHDDHYGHGADCYGDGHHAYPSPSLGCPRLLSLYHEADCPYTHDIRSPELMDCPLQHDRTRPGEWIEEFPPGFGSANPRHDHSHAGEGHGGHSHSQQFPNGEAAPADQGYLVPPSLPSNPMDNSPSRYHDGQVQSDGSIRINGPPPSFPSSSSEASRQDARSRHFESPPPVTL